MSKYPITIIIDSITIASTIWEGMAMNIKERIRASGVYQWEIAEALGVAESTMCKWLRRPEKLEPGKISRIEKAIQEITVQKAGAKNAESC